MEAGRELDAKVAEKVMGWTWLALPAMNDEQHALVPPGFRDASPARWWGHSVLELVPAYSTDISAAWQVVERLNEQWPDQFQMMADATGWAADFIDDGLNTSRWADTAPLAVCRAALAAVESGLSLTH